MRSLVDGLRAVPLLLYLLLAPVPLSAENGRVPINVEADQLEFDNESGRYLAEGNVVLTYEGATLKGDSMWWHPDTGHAQVTGNARFESGDEILIGETFWFNLNNQTGFATNGQLWLKEKNTYIRGRYLERLGKAEYRVEDGRFTTCDSDNPSWEFGAETVDLTVGGFAKARNAKFYLKGTPVFYTPYVTYPVQRERKSGFLFPRFGQSSSKGAQVSLAWYQVIADNQDATFYLDVLTKLGVGAGAEYRYIFGEDQKGEAKIYGILGRDDVDNQLAVDIKHRGPLGEHTRLLADIEWVSDDEYFDDFGELAGEYNKTSTTSTISTNSHWGRVSLGTLVKYIDDLEQSNDSTLQQLPEVRFSLLRDAVADWPVFTQLDTRYTHYWREDGVRGHRLLLRPILAAVSHPLPGVELDAQASWFQRLYWTENGVDDEQSQGVPDAAVRLSSRLSRKYGSKEKQQVLHSVEPELQWSYAPDTDQDDLPLFDSLDRTEVQNLLTLGLINRLVQVNYTSDSLPETLDLLYLRLSQSVDLDQEETTFNPNGDTLLPFRSELVLRPNRRLTLDLDHRLNWEEQRTQRFSALGTFASDNGRHAISAGYRYNRDDYEYAHGGISTAALAPIYADYQIRYDLIESNTLEHRVNLEYRHQCWSLYFQIQERDDETAFLVGLSLSGIGEVGRFGGSLEERGDE